MVGMVSDEMRKYGAELERRRLGGGPLSGPIPSGPLTPDAPLEQQIREASEEVIRWAEQLVERRRFAADAARGLKEAEEMFAERAGHLTRLTEQHRAAGKGLNASKL